MTDPKGKAAPAADWRAELLDEVRHLIRQAAPGAIEEAKWKKPTNPGGVPTWSEHGILCTAETYKDKVKITFAKGARVKDPQGLFNASLEGNVRRAIDLGPSDRLDRQAFIELVRAAVEVNRGRDEGE